VEEPRSQNPGARRRQPWSVPRLRGRGKQGDIITHAVPLSTLCIALIENFLSLPDLGNTASPYLGRRLHRVHDRALHTEMALADDVSLCTTASQARQRSTAGAS
jgi:hypothetical protein